MVEKGDFSQEIRFMGEFSTAFNSMVSQLNKTLGELKSKEETLVSLTETLRREVDRRNHAVEALQESEARFKYLASHDALTGAFSRRSFIEMAGAELKNAAKSGVRCCMAIMDIDHFKNFNDTYGHLAGDETLRHVVRIVNAGLRKGDFLGRYGGEEFTIFFYNADEKAGLAIAERLRAALEANPVKLETGDVQVTASFGVAAADISAPAADEGDAGKADAQNDVRSLVNNADIALYAAKRAGRNRVMFFTQNIAGELDAVAQHEGRFAGEDAADIESAEEFKKRGEEFPAE
jgi:diguanylate cyclase (GGDEF)-like protein